MKELHGEAMPWPWQPNMPQGEECNLSEQNPKRKTPRHADKHVALRVRQISALLGAVLILTAAVFWVTGMMRSAGTDTYTGKNPLMDPALIDPALHKADDWLEVRIQKHIDEMDSQDLSDFRRILPSLDQGYIGGLVAGGLDATEQGLLQDHLLSKLSPADYTRGKELFSIYLPLLTGE